MKEEILNTLADHQEKEAFTIQIPVVAVRLEFILRLRNNVCSDTSHSQSRKQIAEHADKPQYAAEAQVMTIFLPCFSRKSH